MELFHKGFAKLAADLASGKLTSSAMAEAFLERQHALNGKIRAVLSLDEEKLRRDAAASDARRAAGKPIGPYDGILIGVKDNIAVAGEIVSCSSKLLVNVRSPYDATVISRLKEAGLIPCGRLNMDEFAMGSSCENSAFAPTHNPYDLNRVPGGSSGGSAAAVGARLFPAALGSDTGGSIRQPAAFCGTVGLKPTYGLVSRYGLVAFASSLDQIGPLTNSVQDAAILLSLIAGGDKADSTSLPTPCRPVYSVAEGKELPDLKGIRIGLPKEYAANEGLSPAVKTALEQSIALLKKLGAEMVDVSLPHTEYAVSVYYILATAEASANLARFDGIRYGARTMDKDLIGTYFTSRGAGFGNEVKRRILLGTYVLSSGYYDSYYLRAQKVRTLIRRDFEEAAKLCDVLLTPVTPGVAFRHGEKADPLSMYLSDIFTIALNLAGNCGISVPAMTDSETGMPVGIQFIAPALQEEKLFSVARVFEREREEKEFFPAL